LSASPSLAHAAAWHVPCFINRQPLVSERIFHA